MNSSVLNGGQAYTCEHWRRDQIGTSKHRGRGSSRHMRTSGEGIKQAHANIRGGGQADTCKHWGSTVKQTHATIGGDGSSRHMQTSGSGVKQTHENIGRAVSS